MCNKQTKQISNYLHHDCLSISILLHTMLACLTPLTELFNDVCLHNACLFPFFYFAPGFSIVIYTNPFCIHALCLGY